MRNSRNVPNGGKAGSYNSTEPVPSQLRQLDLDDKYYGRAYRRQTGGAPQKGTSNYPLRLRDGAGVFTECAMCNCPRAGPSASV
jgi:hypothetical protein